jgi:hypothetical protein
MLLSLFLVLTINKAGAEAIVVIDSVAGYVARNNGAGVYKAIMDFSDAARAYFREKGVQE